MSLARGRGRRLVRRRDDLGGKDAARSLHRLAHWGCSDLGCPASASERRGCRSGHDCGCPRSGVAARAFRSSWGNVARHDVFRRERPVRHHHLCPASCTGRHGDVPQRNRAATSRMREIRESGSVGAPGGKLPAGSPAARARRVTRVSSRGVMRASQFAARRYFGQAPACARLDCS